MRNIIYHDIMTTCPKDGSDGRIYIDGEEKDLLSIVMDLEAESRKEKAEVYVNVLGLNTIGLMVVNYLTKMGYDYNAGTRKKDLRKNTMRYSMNDRNIYYIQARTSGYNTYLTMQCVEPVIGLKGIPETKEKGIEALELYHETRDRFLYGVKKSETRLLYSAGTISRTMFNRQNKSFTKSILLLQGDITYHGEKIKKNQFCEKFCRPAVHGGYNVISEKGYTYHGPGIVADKNSLYPYVAVSEYLPTPEIVKIGEGEPDRKYNNKRIYYTIVKAEVTAKLKTDGIACIEADAGQGLISQPYLTKMNKRIITMTEADQAMLKENYNIESYNIREYIVFKASNRQFRDYVMPLYDEKKNARDDIKRRFAKIMLNGLIGTFARQIYKEEYFLSEVNGRVIKMRRDLTEEEIHEQEKKVSGLCYINASIVSAAKMIIVNDIKKTGDRYLYTDTDSIHMSGQELPEWLTVSNEIGDYKIEHRFEACCYKHIKNYMLIENGRLLITTAGVPKDTLDHIDDGRKIKGIDYKYIKEAVRNGHFGRLYRKPLPVHRIKADLTSGTIYYETIPAMLERKEKRYNVKTTNDAQVLNFEEYRDKALQRQAEQDGTEYRLAKMIYKVHQIPWRDVMEYDEIPEAWQA